jgi:transcription elongation factor Elf1
MKSPLFQKQGLDAFLQQLNDPATTNPDDRTDKEFEHPYGSKGTEIENVKQGSDPDLINKIWKFFRAYRVGKIEEIVKFTGLTPEQIQPVLQEMGDLGYLRAHRTGEWQMLVGGGKVGATWGLINDIMGRDTPEDMPPPKPPQPRAANICPTCGRGMTRAYTDGGKSTVWVCTHCKFGPKTGTAKPRCPHCGSEDYSLMPTDFETAKCDDCGKNWDHGIVPGINDPKTAAGWGKAILPAVALMGLGQPPAASPTVVQPRPAIVQQEVKQHPSDPHMDRLVNAIARAEGAKPERNNPGNIVDFGTGKIKTFDTMAEGDAALREQLKRIADGLNPNFDPKMSLRDAGLVYSNGDPNWAKNVASIMRVSQDVPIGHLIKGTHAKHKRQARAMNVAVILNAPKFAAKNAPDPGQYDEKHEEHVRQEMKQWAQYAEEEDNTEDIKPFDPEGNYLCGDCDMRQGTNECMRVQGPINFEKGSCRLFHEGAPENQLPMAKKFTQAEAKYGESNQGGFGCHRCEYGGEAKEADGAGRPSWCSFWGTHVVPNACCSEQELVQIQPKEASFQKQALDPQLVTLLGSWVVLMLAKWFGQKWQERFGDISNTLTTRAANALQKQGVTSLATLDRYAQEQGTDRYKALGKLALQQLILAAAVTTGISAANLFNKSQTAPAAPAKPMHEVTDMYLEPVPAPAPAKPQHHGPTKKQVEEQKRQQKELEKQQLQQQMEQLREQDAESEARSLKTTSLKDAGIVNPRPAMRRREERNIYDSLKRHKELMDKYVAEGMSPEDASKKAMDEIKRKKGRELMHDDSGATTGLRMKPDYGESDSYTSKMNEANKSAAAKIKWRVDPPPTGQWSSFSQRAWPSADYVNGDPAASIHCSEEYRPANVKSGQHPPLKVWVADWNIPPEERGKKGRWVWRAMKGEFATLKEAQAAAAKLIDAHPELHTLDEPAPPEGKTSSMKNPLLQKKADWTMTCPHCKATARKKNREDDYKCESCPWTSKEEPKAMAHHADVEMHETPTMLPPRDDMKRHLDEDVQQEIDDGVDAPVQEGIKVGDGGDDFERGLEMQDEYFNDQVSDAKREAREAFMQDKDMQEDAASWGMTMDEFWQLHGDEYANEYWAGRQASKKAMKAEEGIAVCPKCTSSKVEEVTDDEGSEIRLFECGECAHLFSL